MKNILSRYTIEESLNSTSLVDAEPALYSAFDLTSDANVLVKVWSRRTGIDDDLLLLWEAELRQMQRFDSLPGVNKYLIVMQDAGLDESGFYLILGPGDVRPLDWQLKQSRKRNTLSTKQTQRKLLWSNLNRIAIGLGILHSQGLIHRNVSESAVFTECGPTPDFRLGGFEWNIRLNAFGDEIPPSMQDATKGNSVSFQQDWQAFAQLSMRLLGISVKDLAASPLNDKESVAEGLKISEQNLLRKLIHPAPNDRPDTELVLKQIEKIIVEYTTSSTSDKLTLCVIYDHQKVGNNLVGLLLEDELSHCDVTDPAAVIDFICQDLLNAEIIELRQEQQHHHRFAAIGHEYIYLLNEHTQYAWLFPKISRITRNMPVMTAICSRNVPPQGTMLLRSPRQLADKLIQLRVEAEPWDSVFEETTPDSESIKNLKFTHDAYLWLHLIDGLQQAAEAWPVEVISVRERRHREYTIGIRFVEDDRRRKLSNALGLKPPLDRLIERLVNPRDENDKNWFAIRQARQFHSKERHEFALVDISDQENGEEEFLFSSSIQFVVNEKLLLRPSDSGGDSNSLRRRKKLIARLAEHEELLNVLKSPLITARKSHDEIPSLDYKLLDESKQQAMLEMINVLPMYLLQGPPGTGKTHLVSQLVKHIVTTNRSPRLLITAQGHDPINNLMVKIADVLNEAEEDVTPLMVRSRGRRDEQIESSTHLKQQATQLMDLAIGSNMFKSAPKTLQRKLCQSLAGVQKISANEQFPDKALESLIFRSANIVFSTTNSSDLEEMADMSAHFDWSIVEEAGRATGVELLAPLMLSHRRLLIGDSQQLPSFGEDQIKRLLREPKTLHDALVQGRLLLDSTFNNLSLDDLQEKFAEPNFAARMASEVNRHLTLFSSLHDELLQQRGTLPLAGQLTSQYRMHPEIARMVSKVFYNDELITPENAPIRKAKPPFQIANAKQLPESPIVIVDTPYWHQQGAAWAREEAPAHHNPGEVKMVLKILALVRCSKTVEKPARIAVLTPYSQQVIKLKRAIAAKSNTDLKHLNRFDTSIDMVQTIDSFQGKEADIVVISLVRNNARSWKRALGFLADSRRMNVLLSRAKFKLVIVGSLEFLNLRFLPGKPFDESDELYFLHEWLKYTQEYSCGSLNQNPITIITPSQLGGRKAR